MKFSMKAKQPLPIELEDSEGVNHQLLITPYTVDDGDYMQSLIKPYVENGKIKEDTNPSIFMTINLMGCLKDIKGNRYFEGKTAEEVCHSMPQEFLTAISREAVNVVNPVSNSTLDDEKKSS